MFNLNLQSENGIDVFGKKARIFEHAEQRQIDKHAPKQRPFALVLVFHADFQTAEIVYHNRQHHDKHINRLAPGIEEQAGNQQYNVSVLFFGRKIQNENDRKKNPQKYQRTKDHYSVSPHSPSGSRTNA